MELKGKVASVSKGYGGMYPVMCGELGEPERTRVELELPDGGRLCLNVEPKLARQYRVGDDVTVTLSDSGAPAEDTSGT